LRLGEWALAVFLVLATLNHLSMFNLPGLVLDGWVKTVHYNLDGFSFGYFSGVWGMHVWQAVVALALFGSCWGWGDAALGWSISGPAGGGLLVRLSLGLGLAGLLGLGLGLAGIFHAVPVAIILIAVAVPVLIRSGVVVGAWADLRLPVLDSPMKKFLAGSLALAGAGSLLVALGPEGGWDPAYYHLRLPKMYALHHRIFLVPYIYPSHYPQGIEMLYGLSWLFGGEGAAKLVNFAFWPLCGFAIMRLAGSLGLRSGFQAAALALILPLAGTLASENYIDLGLTFLEIMALESAWRGRMVPAGLLLGFAMGSKYTGILAAGGFIMGLAVLRARPRSISLAVLAAAWPVLPWLAKNWLFTADPVAPFFYGNFGGPDWAWGISQSAMGEVIPRLYPHSIMDKSMALVSGLWSFLKFNSFAVYTPMVIGMAPVLVFRSHSRGELFLKAFVLAFTALCLALSPDGRYWQPASFILCICAAVWWERLAAGPRVPAAVVGAVAVVSMAFGAVYHFADMQAKFTSAFVALGIESREEYLSRTRYPFPWYSGAAAWLNREVPARERVAVVSDVQAYMIDSDAIFDCDACSCRWITALVRREAGPGALARQFRRWNVRTVLYIRNKALAGAKPENWTAAEAGNWSGFWGTHAVPVFRYGECVVYRISSKPLPSRTLLDMPGPQEWAVARLLDAGTPRQARRAVLDRVLKMGVDSAFLRGAYGEIAMDRGDPADGIGELRAAVRIVPDLAPAWLSLTRCLLRAGRMEEARRTRARWEAIDPLSEDRGAVELEFARVRNLE